MSCPFKICGVDSKSINNDKICLRNYQSGNIYTDTVFKESVKSKKCTKKVCMSAFVNSDEYQTEHTLDEKILDAKNFFDQYYSNKKELNSDQHLKRIDEVINSLKATNYYELNESEVLYGAKMCWRNASRCVGRAYWSSLELIDARYAKNAQDMYDVICNKFLPLANNNGQPKSILLLFPQRKGPNSDFRVWNKQLINYACYEVEKDVFIGDKAQLEFTQICQKLGWKGKGTEFDVLPLVLQANGQKPELFELPKELIMEVKLSHPDYDFAALNMKWFVTVTVSVFMFDIGGCQFPGAPFSGFYTAPEIARAMLDLDRYNKMNLIAEKMGIDTRTSDSLWRDRCIIEMNLSVLYSYQKSGKYVIDHHTIAEKFKEYFISEQKSRGGCPSDWVWIVSQLSSHLDETFFMEMVSYKLKPSIEYQMPLTERIKEIEC